MARPSIDEMRELMGNEILAITTHPEAYDLKADAGGWLPRWKVVDRAARRLGLSDERLLANTTAESALRQLVADAYVESAGIIGNSAYPPMLSASDSGANRYDSLMKAGAHMLPRPRGEAQGEDRSGAIKGRYSGMIFY